MEFNLNWFIGVGLRTEYRFRFGRLRSRIRRGRRSSSRRSASGPTSGDHRPVFYGFGLLVQKPSLLLESFCSRALLLFLLLQRNLIFSESEFFLLRVPYKLNPFVVEGCPQLSNFSFLLAKSRSII